MNLELLKSLVVLYVEDDQRLREDVINNLTDFVKQIIVAKDGENGFELFKKYHNEIDVVITDILMPNMNGITMVDKIQTVDREIPIIYTTAFNDVNYLQKTIKQSIVAYILKPIDIEQLLEAINRASFKVENKRLKNHLIDVNNYLELEVLKKTKKLEEQNRELQYQLYTDNLTQLPNRKAFFRDLSSYKNPILYLIDIDKFTSINDHYSEAIGDLTIRAVAKLLESFNFQKAYGLYKVGSDIFALVKELEGAEEILSVQNSIEELLELITSKPLILDSSDIYLKINVTISASTEEIHTFETADMAMKKAKKEHVPFLIYQSDFNLAFKYEEDLRWTRILEKSIHNGTLVAYYQPIVSTDESIIKYEALVRIVENDEVHLPYKFLDIAKESKLYTNITRIMIDNVYTAFVEKGISVTLNLSLEDMINDDICAYILDKLQDKKFASHLTLEILETENIINYDKVFQFIDSVKAMGCSIAIDDFGSGYSNFVYLLRLKPDFIKIDGSLIKNINKDRDSYVITQMINDFAHQMGIQTVAEFVHSKEIFEILQELDIDFYQGFYFSEPKRDV